MSDHAGTLREAIKAHVPDGYDQVDLGWTGALRRECLDALDELVADVERWHREALDWQQAKSEADDVSEAAEAQSRESSEMFLRCNEQCGELLSQQSFMEKRLVTVTNRAKEAEAEWAKWEEWHGIVMAARDELQREQAECWREDERGWRRVLAYFEAQPDADRHDAKELIAAIEQRASTVAENARHLMQSDGVAP